METKRKHRDRNRAKHKNANGAAKNGFGENTPSSLDSESVTSSKHSAHPTVPIKTTSETVPAGEKRDKSDPSPVPGPSTGRGRSKSKSPSRSRSSSVSRKRNRRSRSRSHKRKRRSNKSKHCSSKSRRRRSRSSSRSWSSSSARGFRKSRDRHLRSRSRSNSRSSSSPERRRKLSSSEAVEDFLEKNKRAAMMSRSSNDTNRNNSSLHNSNLFNSTKIKQEDNMIFHEKLMLQASGKWTEEMELRWKLNENEIKELKIYTSSKVSQLKETAEDHPDYDSEWTKFWKAKYFQVQDMGKDPDKYDYTPEWKIFWLMSSEKRLLEEHDVKLKGIRRKHGMDLDTISSLNFNANKQPAPMPAQRIRFGVVLPPRPPPPIMNFPRVFVPGYCPFPPPFIRSRSGRLRLPLLPIPAVFPPYYPPHPFPVPVPGNGATFRHGFYPVPTPVPPPQPVPAPANVNLPRANPPVPVPVPRSPQQATTTTTSNQLKPKVNTTAPNCSIQSVKVKVSDDVSTSTPRQLDPLGDRLCNSTESDCNTANPPKVTLDEFSSSWRSLTGQNLLDAAKSAVEASTKSKVSVEPHKDDNIYDGLNVVQVLNLMLSLDDHLSFLSLKVQEYLKKAEKAESIKLGKSYSMLQDKEFTALLLKCRDKFFTIYRAKVCSSSIMKKLNFAIFAMNALIDSYNCEKAAQVPATAPAKNTEAMSTISIVSRDNSAESRDSGNETVEVEKEFTRKGVNSASTVELTPEKLIPAPIPPLRSRESRKQNGFHPTSLDPKPSPSPPADLPSGSSLNGNHIIDNNNPIAARLAHIPQEIKEEISSTIADFLIAQGKGTLTESELFSHLLSIFGPAMKVEDSEVVEVKVKVKVEIP